jgi:hypothetical protein
MKTFFYRFNGEIYEMKFTKFIVEVDGDEVDMKAGNYHVIMATADIAEIGIKTYEYKSVPLYNNMRLDYIYETIEKAIEGVEPMFPNKGKDSNLYNCKVVMDGHNVRRPHNTSIVHTYYNKKISNGNIRTPFSIHGTWVWNGFKPIFTTHIGASSVHGYINGEKYLLYDIVEEIFLLNTDIVNRGYATSEECTKANHVKVHRL